MRTTIELPDELVREVKAMAREQGVSMRELVVDGLRSEIARRTRKGMHADLDFPTYKGAGTWAPDDLAGAITDSFGERA